MASVYCWFDWEDDTTTVNSISVIREPRKPWNEYEVGERIIAKLPKYGTWTGIIVEISDSKEDLISHMNARQQYPVYTDLETATGDNIGMTALPLEGSRSKKKNRKAGTMVNEEKLDDSADDDISIADSGTDPDSSRPKKKVKRAEKNREKTIDSEIDKKSKEEKLKKVLEKARLETKTREYEDIIADRATDISNLGQPTNDEQPAEQAVQYNPGTNIMNTCIYTGNSSWTDYGQNMSQNYSYVQDLRETDTSIQWGTVYQPLLSYQELLERNRDLEAENHNLRQEVKDLKDKLELRSPPQGALRDLEVTPKKVEFFKRLTRTLEISQKQSCVPSRQLFEPSCSSPSKMSLPVPICTPQNSTPSQSITTTSVSPVLERQIDIAAHVQSVETDKQYHWEENVTSTGQKKVQLAGDISCYITQSQLSHVLHVGSQPRKLVIALLDVLFTREQLSQSSSIGARMAVNALTKTKALPSSAVKAIKMFVLKQFKNDSGEPCMTDTLFNTVINSKCATARRALKSSMR